MTLHATTSPTRTRSTASLALASLAVSLAAFAPSAAALSLESSGAVVAQAQSTEPLREALDEYGRFMNQIIEDGRPMEVVEHLDWIDRIEIAALQSSDPKLRHTGYVVLMSLANGLQDWATAEQFCLAALDDAPDEVAEFERLGDLYAVRAMLYAQEGTQERRDQTQRLDALPELLKRWKGFIDRDELHAPPADAIVIAHWALRNEVDVARRTGLGDRETAARAIASLRFLESLEASRPVLVNPIEVRHARSVAAAAYLEMGELLNAQGVFSICDSVQVNSHEITTTYNLLSEASFADRARFVRLMNVPRFKDPGALDVLNKLARDAIDAHARVTSSPTGPRGFQRQQILDEVAYTFVELERLISIRLTQPQVRRDNDDTLFEEVNRMRYALRRLTTYLRNTGEDGFADSYAQILSAQYGDPSYLRD